MNGLARKTKTLVEGVVLQASLRCFIYLIYSMISNCFLLTSARASIYLMSLKNKLSNKWNPVVTTDSEDSEANVHDSGALCPPAHLVTQGVYDLTPSFE